MTSCPHCGCDIEPTKKGKPRSVPQHRRYFVMVKRAFDNWPEAHDFRPGSEKHLRRWLQCKAGYYICDTVDAAGKRPDVVVASIAAAMKRSEHPFVKFSDTNIYIFHSRSIDFNELPHLKACALFDAVAEVIAAEMRIPVEAVLPAVSAPKPSARDELRESAM